MRVGALFFLFKSKPMGNEAEVLLLLFCLLVPGVAALAIFAALWVSGQFD